MRNAYFSFRITHPAPGPFFIEQKARRRGAKWEELARVQTFDLALQIMAVLSFNRSIYGLCEALGVNQEELQKVAK